MINDDTDDQNTLCTCGHTALHHVHVLSDQESCGRCDCQAFTRAPGQGRSANSFRQQAQRYRRLA